MSLLYLNPRVSMRKQWILTSCVVCLSAFISYLRKPQSNQLLLFNQWHIRKLQSPFLHLPLSPEAADSHTSVHTHTLVLCFLFLFNLLNLLMLGPSLLPHSCCCYAQPEPQLHSHFHSPNDYVSMYKTEISLLEIRAIIPFPPCGSADCCNSFVFIWEYLNVPLHYCHYSHPAEMKQSVLIFLFFFVSMMREI